MLTASETAFVALDAAPCTVPRIRSPDAELCCFWAAAAEAPVLVGRACTGTGLVVGLAAAASFAGAEKMSPRLSGSVVWTYEGFCCALAAAEGLVGAAGVLKKSAVSSTDASWGEGARAGVVIFAAAIEVAFPSKPRKSASC